MAFLGADVRMESNQSGFIRTLMTLALYPSSGELLPGDFSALRAAESQGSTTVQSRGAAVSENTVGLFPNSLQHGLTSGKYPCQNAGCSRSLAGKTKVDEFRRA